MKIGSIIPNSPTGQSLLKSHPAWRTSRDAVPVVVSKDGKRCAFFGHILPSVRELIENWQTKWTEVNEIYRRLNSETSFGLFINEADFHSPLPRSFQWIDGSAFIQHVRLVRKARNAPLPDDLLTTPLMYQGGSDCFLAPYEDIPLVDEKHGMDFEGEVVVVTSDVPMGVTAEKALDHILLVMLCNDVSLRGLIPEELARGFGFFQSKPSSSFSPFALTLDELEHHWKEGRIHLPLLTFYNEKTFGRPDAGEMHFHFGQLISHAARTRNLAAGSIVGSGTVSNEDPSKGGSCLAEKRMLEQIHQGKISTAFMKHGDTIKIQMLDTQGNNLFGSIFQKINLTRISSRSIGANNNE